MYGYSFTESIRLELYKNFLSLASSYWNETDYSSHSSLIIFSYPQTIENSLNIVEILYYDNETKINNLSAEMTGLYDMDNNLFGLVYSGIEIIENCDCEEGIYLADSNNEKIISDYFLPKNEKIKIVLPKKDNYAPFNCKFKYASVVTEPKLSEFNIYPNSYYDFGTKEEEFFDNLKTNYVGKHNNYYIELSYDLTKFNCEDKNCDYCYLEDNNICVSCKYSSYFLSNLTKICLDGPIEEESSETVDSSENIESSETEVSRESEESSETIESTESEESSETIESTESEESSKTIESSEEDESKNNESDNNNQSKETIINNSDNNIIESCDFEKIIENKCDSEITNGQVMDVYSHIKSNLINHNHTIIKTNNIIFEVSPITDQINLDNKNVSNVDLGECESRLKMAYNIDSLELIIFKIDIKNVDQTTTYVQYEIYHPITHTPLSLDVCSDLNINIYAPVSLDGETLLMFSSLEDSGYNLFDSNDSFYNDLCTPYTTVNGTDILLGDRKKDIYSKNGNKTLCQTDCSLLYYNETNQKATCNCETQVNKTNLNLDLLSTIIFEGDILEESFFNTLNNSNFLVMKCYKLAFDLNSLFVNIGRIIMTIIFFFFLLMCILYIILGIRKLKSYLMQLLKQKVYKNNNNIKENISINKMHDIKIRRKKSTKISPTFFNIEDDKNKNLNMLSQHNNNIFVGKKKLKRFRRHKSVRLSMRAIENEKKEENCLNPIFNINKKSSKSIHSKSFHVRNRFKPQIKNSEVLSVVPKKKSITHTKSIHSISNSNNTKSNQNIIFSNNIYIKMNKGRNKKKKIVSKNFSVKNSKDSFISGKFHKKKLLGKSNYKDENHNSMNNNYIYFTNQELNTMDYKEALIYDKRTYFQYYWSLVKKKQLILFIIINNDDYNLVSVKISLFLISFSLYFTLNGFFFNDNTMHKLYKNNGEYDFITQIPILCYSTIITTVINMILKTLSLSEKIMLGIKKETNVKRARDYSKTAWSSIQLKIFIFFILSVSLMCFFWYFISCFCAVYKNTQIILISDTLISFGLSNLYPFGINLIPGIFRIPALRSNEKNKECLYKMSVFVSLI